MRTTRLPRLGAAVLMLALAAPRTVGAQVTWRTVGEDFKNGLSDMIYVWASPLRADSRDWLTAAGVLGGGAAVAVYDDEIQDWVARHPSSVPVDILHPFTEEADYLVDLGSGRRLVPLGGVLYIAGLITDSRALRDAGIGCAASQQVQTLTHDVAFRVLARHRPRGEGDTPYVIGADPYEFEYFQSSPWVMHSFYGGHGANAMACATFFNERFDLGIAEPILYATAIAVGLARVPDGRHWTSDTLIGLVFGHVVGRTVARRSLERARERERGESASLERTAEPSGGLFVDGDSRGLLLGWRRTF